MIRVKQHETFATFMERVKDISYLSEAQCMSFIDHSRELFVRYIGSKQQVMRQGQIRRDE